MQVLKRSAYDDAIVVLCQGETRENFWFAYKNVKNATKIYGHYTTEVRAELFAIRDLVLQNNDVATASYRLAKLADKLSKMLREEQQ